jgi:hypothetical protein
MRRWWRRRRGGGGGGGDVAGTRVVEEVLVVEVEVMTWPV